MIVEYLGIPGSGKTYQMNLYKQKLQDERIPYLDISRYFGMSIWLKVFYKIADYIIYILPKYKKQINQYNKVCEECTETPNYFSMSLKICIRDIVLSSLLHDLFGKSNKNILNDEGQLLRIVTIAVLYDIAPKELMRIYNKEKHLEETRFIQIPIEDAFNNIRKRKRHVCKMDEMSDEILMDYLRNFDNICRICIQLIDNSRITLL